MRLKSSVTEDPRDKSPEEIVPEILESEFGDLGVESPQLSDVEIHEYSYFRKSEDNWEITVTVQ